MTIIHFKPIVSKWNTKTNKCFLLKKPFVHKMKGIFVRSPRSLVTYLWQRNIVASFSVHFQNFHFSNDKWQMLYTESKCCIIWGSVACTFQTFKPPKHFDIAKKCLHINICISSIQWQVQHMRWGSLFCQVSVESTQTKPMTTEFLQRTCEIVCWSTSVVHGNCLVVSCACSSIYTITNYIRKY